MEAARGESWPGVPVLPAKGVDSASRQRRRCSIHADAFPDHFAAPFCPISSPLALRCNVLHHGIAPGVSGANLFFACRMLARMLAAFSPRLPNASQTLLKIVPSCDCGFAALRAGPRTRNSARRCCTIGPALTGELLEHILAKLPLPDRLACATVSPDFATAFRCTVSGLAIDLRQRSRDIGRRLTDSPVTTVAIATPAACTAHGSAAAAAAQAQLWDPEEQRLWQEAANRRLHPAGVAWRLKRACSGLTGGGKKVGGAKSRPRVLTLVLVAPEMDTSTAVLQRMLVAADAEALFAAVSMPQGLLRLDGALASKLTWCNVRAASLPAALQVPPGLHYRCPCPGVPCRT